MWDRSRAYRPELYYMRGPGPKWREKNGLVSPQTTRPALEPMTVAWLIPAATALLLAVVTVLAFA